MMADRMTAVITGAGGGIGRAVVDELARSGHDLVLVDRAPAVEDLAAELRAAGHRAKACVVSLLDPDASDVVAAAIDQRTSPLGVLVNNAGITADARLANMTPQGFRSVVDVNLLGTMQFTLGLGDRLSFAQGASIVSVSSRAALGNFGQVNYVASKAGLMGFTRSLALRWAGRARVNAVAPGLIQTPMTDAMPDPVRDKLVGRIPLGRIGTARDVAQTISFLAGPSSSYITGQVVLCCGGRSVAA